jgi:hypothetical protein
LDDATLKKRVRPPLDEGDRAVSVHLRTPSTKAFRWAKAERLKVPELIRRISRRAANVGE